MSNNLLAEITSFLRWCSNDNRNTNPETAGKLADQLDKLTTVDAARPLPRAKVVRCTNCTQLVPFRAMGDEIQFSHQCAALSRTVPAAEPPKDGVKKER